MNAKNKRSKSIVASNETNDSLAIVNNEFDRKMHELDLKYQIENRESSFNRARSVTVGTSFGGTTELMMRGDGSKHLWCVMQPVEVIELIYQLAANVGVIADLKPRKDFSSWRDWRISELEKENLNGHPPFVNDMAPFNNLGIKNFNDAEVSKLMDLLAKAKPYLEENENVKIVDRETKYDGAPGVMIGEDDGLLYNKIISNENGEMIGITGGSGGEGMPPSKPKSKSQKS